MMKTSPSVKEVFSRFAYSCSGVYTFCRKNNQKDDSYNIDNNKNSLLNVAGRPLVNIPILSILQKLSAKRQHVAMYRKETVRSYV